MHSFIHSFIHSPTKNQRTQSPHERTFRTADRSQQHNNPSVARNVSIQYVVSFFHTAIDRHCRTQLGVVYVLVVSVLL